MTWPVTCEAPSEHRKTQTSAISFARFENTRVRPHEAGIVERVVQAAIPLHSACDHMLHFGRFGHIDPNCACFATIVSDRGSTRFCGSAVDITNHHARALSRK